MIAWRDADADALVGAFGALCAIAMTVVILATLLGIVR
jgi:hypothetical protein